MMMLRDDVALLRAQFCWNDGGEALVVEHGGHMSRRQMEQATSFDNATGACFAHWQGLSDNGRLVELMRDAFMAVKRDEADKESVFDALCQIPEFRAQLHVSDVPDRYRQVDEAA
jgi:hypothetical protein